MCLRSPPNHRSPTATKTPIPCGPYPGWVLYTIRPGDTLYSLAELFQHHRVAADGSPTACPTRSSPPASCCGCPTCPRPPMSRRHPHADPHAHGDADPHQHPAGVSANPHRIRRRPPRPIHLPKRQLARQVQHQHQPARLAPYPNLVLSWLSRLYHPGHVWRPVRCKPPGMHPALWEPGSPVERLACMNLKTLRACYP